MPWLWVLVQTCPGDLHLPPGVYLVGGLEMFGTCFMTFHSVGNFIIPTDFHSIILQMGRYTTNRLFIWIFRSRVSIFRGAPDGPSEKNPRQSENQGPIHGFGGLEHVLLFHMLERKIPSDIFQRGWNQQPLYLYIYTCVMSVTSLCAMYQTQHVFIKTQHDLRICPYWKVVEFQPDELGDSTGATSAWLKEAADALGGGSGCVR